jgi:hypothetical protein
MEAAQDAVQLLRNAINNHSAMILTGAGVSMAISGPATLSPAAIPGARAALRSTLPADDVALTWGQFIDKIALEVCSLFGLNDDYIVQYQTLKEANLDDAVHHVLTLLGRG